MPLKFQVLDEKSNLVWWKIVSNYFVNFEKNMKEICVKNTEILNKIYI